jgi:AsmA protein
MIVFTGPSVSSAKVIMSRKLRIILVSIGIFVLALLLVPFLIPGNQFQPSIEEKTSAALGRKVRLGNLRLSLFSSSLFAEDLSIGDDPSFSPSPFLTAKSLKVGVELMPLIFSKTLNVTGITIQNPQVMLIRNAAGQWNYSSLGGSSANAEPTQTSELAKASSSRSSTASLSIKKLELEDGQINIGSTISEKRSTYDHVSISASDVSVTTRFSVVVTADLPGGGKFKFDGDVGPLDQSNASLTPFNARLNVSSLNLASTGFLDPSLGLGGLLDLDATLGSQNGETETKGTAKLSKALLIAGGSPASKPVVVEFSTKYDLGKNAGVLNPSTLKIGNAAAHLNGTYQTAEETVLNIKLDGQDMPAKDLESFLPALGIILPKGATLQGGTLNANLNLTGPTNKLVATGNVGLFSAKLTGFDLGSKMSAIFSLMGFQAGKDLQIEKLTTNLRMAPDGLKADHLIAVVPSLGNLVGSGTIDSRNNLDFNMTVSLTNALGATGSPVSGTAGMIGTLTGAGGGSNSGTTTAIDLSGTYQLRSQNPSLNLKMTGQKLPIDQLQAGMTAAGIKLPNGAILQGGTLDIALNLSGLTNALIITGPIELNNTQEIGFDFGSRIRGIAALSRINTGDTMSIENLQANLRITNEGTQVVQIYARIPVVGVITGSGTVSPTSDLDFALTVRVTAAQGIAKIGADLLTKLDDSAGSGESGVRVKGVPMLVTGTANEPIIKADVHGLFDRRKKAFLDRFGKKK